MLDVAAYRANETAAKRAIASWRLSNINDPYIFQNQGFPVRTESVLDLTQILDTMQEERFDYYMREIGGFTEEEADFFVDVCVDYIEFYQKTFERDRVIIPLSTMIAHYLIYRKLLGYNPSVTRVLEIGPGCGYLSFFLRHHAPLEDYSQIESTESFYLLQSHINSHVFGTRFAEHAISQRALADHNFYTAKMRWHGNFHYEEQKTLDVRRNPVCNHYPWWRLGDVAQRRFDVVASNANLNEFSREALFQYLSIMRDVIADDGAIVAQCLGGGAPTYDSVFANMKSFGFVPVALLNNQPDPSRTFVVANGVFVGEKHPLYSAYADREPKFSTYDRGLEFINRMYFINEEHPGKKIVMSTADILDLIEARVKISLRAAGAPLRRSALANNGAPGSSIEDKDPLASAADEKALIEAKMDFRQVTLERANVQQRANQLTEELDAIKNSASWRITAPLRSLPPGPKRIIKKCARLARSGLSLLLGSGRGKAS